MYGTLRQYRPNSYPVPWGYPSGPLTIEAAPGTLGDITAAQLAPTLPSGLSTFSSGILSSSWLYIGLAVAAAVVYMNRPVVTVRKRKPRHVAGHNTLILAAGAAAGGYLLSKAVG